jgi:hypothetical protein
MCSQMLRTSCRTEEKAAEEYAEHEQKKDCSRCGQAKGRDEYVSDREWRQSHRKCTSCRTEEKAAEKNAKHEQKKDCSRCGQAKGRDEYVSDREWRQSDRKCKLCKDVTVGSWQCIKCRELKPKEEFSSWLQGRRRQVNDGKARCNVCRSEEELDARAMSKTSLKNDQHLD